MTKSTSRIPSAAARRRSAARLAAVQALYELDLADGSADAVMRDFIETRLGGGAGIPATGEDSLGESAVAGADTGLFTRVVRGTLDRRAQLDQMIASALSKGWTMDRLEAVLRNILRAGAFELSQETSVPPRVAISEYVDVAHAFYSGPEPGLVNAVLDRIAHVVRPEGLSRDDQTPA